MKSRIIRFVCFIFSILLSLFSYGQQEVLVPIIEKDITLKSYNTEEPVSLKTLPFFDDFAYPYSMPLPSLWQKSDAFVNNAFAKNMKTIGVVSLDAMGAEGKLHADVSTSARVSDYLTSQPINLKSYELVYASDKLYRKDGLSFVLLDDTYYIYDKERDLYLSATQGGAYYAGDTIYIKNADVYSPIQDSIYDETKQYIDGSYTCERKWYDYQLEDSLALSFYYQSGGFVDQPESTDSLVLEYYVPYDTCGLFINEICSSGVELYNATDSVVSLAGYFLLYSSLDEILEKDSLSTFVLPEMVISPYRHYVVWAKDYLADSIQAAVAYLYSPDTVLVDSVVLDEKLGTGYGYARMTDGDPTWSYTATLTMGDVNPSWIWIWSNSEKTNDQFVPVYMPIENKSYLVKGFRFRFKNYTSLSNDESHARNEDFWHLDMIWLNAHREKEHIDVPDVAFSSGISPLYSRYKALPMSHFSQVGSGDFKMTILAKFTNFDSLYRKAKFNLSVKKEHTGDALMFSTYEADIPPATTVSERDVLTEFDVDFFDFIADDIGVYDEGTYDFLYYFTDKNNPLYSQYRWNDTCRVALTLSNYYAYDDGTPEAGYGLRDAPMGRVAFKFDILQEDTLKAISTYFNPTMMDQATTFNLCVWDNDNGVPGELLYYSPSERVAYGDGLYSFVDYEIKPENIMSGQESLVVGKTFFVGWEQPNDVLLNMGIDMNQSLNNRLYYNLGFEWENSVQKGALLLRPIFGLYTPKTSVQDTKKRSVAIVPTVAQSEVSIVGDVSELSMVTVVDVLGNVVLETSNRRFSVLGLTNGLYMVRMIDTEGNLSVCKMIVVK